MKKMLLAMALFGVYSASAQDNDFFDTQMKLRKQKEEKKKPRFFPLPAPSIRQSPVPEILSITTPAISPHGRLTGQLADGSKVYALPQDNMPCIVPDMDRFTIMPNKSRQTGHYRGAGAIPNPAAGTDL